MASGRIRKGIETGWTPLVTDVFTDLEMGTLLLPSGQSGEINTGEKEYGFVLIRGHCKATMGTGEAYDLGPRLNPFDHKPYGVMVSRDRQVRIEASQESLIGVGISPAKASFADYYLSPGDVREYQRGSDNWSRTVRFIFWPDNTEGNLLLMGETVVPSGNWGTVPPHRHDTFEPDEEVPYNEVYFFQFSKPQGFGLIWQFDDGGAMDQAFSLKSGDAAYLGEGYHPVACGPGSTMYQLTTIAGPHRVSKARLHPDYAFLTEQKAMANPYKNQR